MAKELIDLAREDTNLKKVSVNELAGPCPKCGGRDRFHIHLAKRDGRGAWMCRVCHSAEEYGWGDAIEYLRTFRKMSFPEARDYLQDGLDSLISHVDQGRREVAPDENEPPKEQWQVKAAHYVDQAQRRLWSPAGQKCLDYLHSRGLQDKTIKAAKLGYVEEEEDGERIPRLVIPWHADNGQYWAVNRRDLREDKPEDAPRYKMIAWSSKKAMYGCSLLVKTRRYATFIVEGELDALTLAQEAGDLPINVVATGGDGMPAIKWIGRLSYIPSLVLLSQDREQRGDEQAAKWLDALNGHALRYRPMVKDVNAMLVEGWSVRTWVEGALDLLPDQVEPSAPAGQTSDGASDMLQDQAARVRAVLEGAPDGVIEDVSVFLTVEMEDHNQAATWLEKARVAWSSRDSAALYALAEQITYPGNLFLSRVGLQLELPPTASEQDAGAAFIDQVSALVASSGAWPDGFALRLVDDTFAARIHALPDRPVYQGYKPVTLQKLPRRMCPFQHATANCKSSPCREKPLANGWCKEHQRSQLLLDMGAALDYPRIELGATAIGEGVACWEGFAAYAVVALKAALPRVKRLYDQAQKEQRAS